MYCFYTCIFSFDGKWEESAYFLKHRKKVKNSKSLKIWKNEDLKSEKKWKKWKKVKKFKKWKDLNSEKTWKNEKIEKKWKMLNFEKMKNRK